MVGTNKSIRNVNKKGRDFTRIRRKNIPKEGKNETQRQVYNREFLEKRLVSQTPECGGPICGREEGSIENSLTLRKGRERSYSRGTTRRVNRINNDLLIQGSGQTLV